MGERLQRWGELVFFMAAVDALSEGGQVGLHRHDALATVCNWQLWCCNRLGLERNQPHQKLHRQCVVVGTVTTG